jgi:hypothetical protein
MSALHMVDRLDIGSRKHGSFGFNGGSNGTLSSFFLDYYDYRVNGL